MNRYAIDANIIINFGIFTPEKYHRQFWPELARQINQGQVVLLDVIAAELRNRALKAWLKTLGPSSITKVDAAIRLRAAEIDSLYGIITQTPTGQTKSVADAYLIAAAELNDLTVFSYESPRLSSSDPMKIPDVCQVLGVNCTRYPWRVMDRLAFANCS